MREDRIGFYTLKDHPIDLEEGQYHPGKPKGIVVEHLLYLDFQMTNNQVEYEALIVGLKLAKDIGVKLLIAKSNW